MIHADPWDEIPRFEKQLEVDLLAEFEASVLSASAESFCVEKCLVDGRCLLAGAIQSREGCPLWTYVRSTASGQQSASRSV